MVRFTSGRAGGLRKQGTTNPRSRAARPSDRAAAAKQSEVAFGAAAPDEAARNEESLDVVPMPTIMAKGCDTHRQQRLSATFVRL